MALTPRVLRNFADGPLRQTLKAAIQQLEQVRPLYRSEVVVLREDLGAALDFISGGGVDVPNPTYARLREAYREVASPVEPPDPKTYAAYLRAYPESEECVARFLTRLRSAIAKDGPHERPAGALEAFDDACEELGVPFIAP